MAELRPRAAWRAYLHPLSLAAMVMLGLNDHVFKASGSLPAWLTGKLSDVSGLFFFPLLCSVLLVEVLRRWVSGSPEEMFALQRRLLGACCGVTAFIFAAIQVSDLAAALYVEGLSLLPIYARRAPHLTMDLSDLLTLPAVWLSHRHGVRFLREEWASMSEPIGALRDEKKKAG